jgi:hypothetical protein
MPTFWRGERERAEGAVMARFLRWSSRVVARWHMCTACTPHGRRRLREGAALSIGAVILWRVFIRWHDFVRWRDFIQWSGVSSFGSGAHLKGGVAQIRWSSSRLCTPTSRWLLQPEKSAPHLPFVRVWDLIWGSSEGHRVS